MQFPEEDSLTSYSELHSFSAFNVPCMGASRFTLYRTAGMQGGPYLKAGHGAGPLAPVETLLIGRLAVSVVVLGYHSIHHRLVNCSLAVAVERCWCGW